MKRYVVSVCLLVAALVCVVALALVPDQAPVHAAPIVEPAPPKEPGFKGFTTHVQYPASLDELYALVEDKAHGWTFTDRGSVPVPFFGWQQVKLIQRLSIDDQNTSQLIIAAEDLSSVVSVGGIDFPSSGTLQMGEDELFALVFRHGLSGNILVCGINGYPVLYGDGVQELFNEIATFVK